MKKTLTFLITILMALSFAACTDTGNNDVVIPEGTDTPRLVGENTPVCVVYATDPELRSGFDFYSDDLIVADVTVRGWLGELDSSFSFFSIKVNDVLHGKLNRDTIVVYQSGASQETMPDQILMDQGERLILVMELEDEECVSELQARFDYEQDIVHDWLQHGVLYYSFYEVNVIELDDGDYVLDKYESLTRPIESSEKTLGYGDLLRKAIVDKARSDNPSLSSFLCPRAYAYDDFVAFVEEYAP